MNLSDDERDLCELARRAAKRAYAPYSNFPVGAAVRTDAGVFRGCNIENASYGLTVCAERVAIWASIAAGATCIKAIAVACVDADSSADPDAKMPCGACRQVLSEFMASDGIVLIDGIGKWLLSDLLPHAFHLP